MTVPRSKLFLAGDRLDGLADAVAAEPDALSIDLEDAVPEAGKGAARSAVAHALRNARFAPQIWLRINGADSGHAVADILAMAGAHIDVVNIPKAEAASDILLVEQLLRHIEAAHAHVQPVLIVPTIESAAGLRNASAIARASSRVLALQLGAGDMSQSTGIARQGAGMDVVRTMLCLAAAEAGVGALDSTPHGQHDLQAFKEEAVHARSLGFRGKSCMLATQVAVANQVFGAVT